MRRFVPLVLLALLLPATPASADVGDPRMSVAWSATDFADGSGRFALATVCAGVGPNAAFVVVWCSVDGLTVETSTPGSAGVAVFTGSAAVPFTVCGRALVVYHDLSAALSPPNCSTHSDPDGRVAVYADVNAGPYEVDRRPGTYLDVPFPYSVPELRQMLCEATPEWTRPCLV